MIPIERLMRDLRKAFDGAMAAGVRSPLLDRPDRLLAMLLRAEERRLRNERRLRVPVPRFCIFSVTWRCNLDCAGCYAKRYPGPGSLRVPVVDRVIREARDLGTVLFIVAGGEPLLVPGLIDRLAAVDGALFLLFTNGTMLTHAHVRKLARAPHIVPVVSVEGTPERTDGRRGPGVAEKVDRAMRLLASGGILFGFASVVTHRNLARITSRAWFDRMWDAGARLAFLIDYIPFPWGADPALVLTPGDDGRKAEALRAREAEARPFLTSFPPDEYAAGDGCQAAGRSFIHINADGYVEPCPFSHYAADSVCEKPLPEILASPFFTELRRWVRSLPNPRAECLLFKHAGEVRSIASRTGAFPTDDRAAGRIPVVPPPRR